MAADDRGESTGSEMARNERTGGGEADVLLDAVHRCIVRDEGLANMVKVTNRA